MLIICCFSRDSIPEWVHKVMGSRHHQNSWNSMSDKLLFQTWIYGRQCLYHFAWIPLKDVYMVKDHVCFVIIENCEPVSNFSTTNFYVNHNTLSRSEIWVGIFKRCYIRRLLIFCAKLGNVSYFTSNMTWFAAKWTNVWLRWFCQWVWRLWRCFIINFL